MAHSVTERIAQNLRAHLKAHKLRQNDVAKRAGHHPPWLNGILNGRRNIRVRDLDALATAARIPVAELVAEPGTLKQLTADEASLVRWFRDWPATVQQGLLGFLRFWADEAPADRQARQLHELIRRASGPERTVLLGFALERAGRVWPKGLEQALVDIARGDATTDAGTPKGRQRRDGP